MSSILKLRLDFQNLEKDINETDKFPSKEDMKKELTREGERIYNSIHYIKVFYFVRKSNSKLAKEIRQPLVDTNVELDDFCKMIAKIYRRTSYRILNPTISLSKEELKDGLRYYGVDLFEEIKSRPLSKYEPLSFFLSFLYGSYLTLFCSSVGGGGHKLLESCIVDMNGGPL